MKRDLFSKALTFGLAASAAVLLASCDTLQDRISQNPAIYQSLSARDQQLVSQGQIRSGMPINAVWLAWGTPELKTHGEIQGHVTETWIYTWTRGTAYGSGYYPYYGYGPGWGWGYGGFGGVGVIRGHGGHGRFVLYGNPYYDPFFYDPFPTVTYPYKVVTFASGRVMSFQFLVPQSTY